MTLIEEAERELAHAEREHHRAQTAERAAREKVEAAARRLANLHFKSLEADMDIERVRRERQ